MIWNRKNALFVFVLLTSLNVLSQVTSISPYSRFGLGDQRFEGFLHNKHMGSMGVGLSDSLHVNPYNPASYSSLRLSSFEVGLNSEYWNLQTSDLQENNNVTYMNHISLGVPLGEKFGMAFGLYPVSNLGYDIQNPDSLEGFGSINYLYKGSGGVSSFFGGLAWEPVKGLSIGVNMSFLFGTQNRSTSVEYDSTGYLNTRFLTTTRIRNVLFDYGIQYRKNFKKKKFVVLGLTYGQTTNMALNYDYTMFTYRRLNDLVIVKDTITSEVNRTTNIAYPEQFGAGFTYGKQGKWLIGADYKFVKWSEYRDIELGDTLADLHTFSLGGYYVPDALAPSGFWNRVQYRAGIYYGQTPLYLNQTNVYDYGMTFGLGLPFLSKTMSTFNIGGRIGQRGTTANGLIQENYFQLNIGLTLNDRWFIRRKID